MAGEGARGARAGGARGRGQGTVEYVGLILLVAVILAGVVKASGGLKDSTIAEAVIKKLKGAIDSVGEGGGRGAAAGACQTQGAAMTVAPEEVRRRPVGVFDSGVGGLTVLHELLVRLPHEDYLYLADSARLPYGSKRPSSSRRSRSRSPRSCSRGGSSCWWSPATRRPPRRCPRCASG